MASSVAKQSGGRRASARALATLVVDLASGLALACALVFAVACSGGDSGALETVEEYDAAALEQLQLSDCERAQLARALEENSEEIWLAEAESARLAARGIETDGPGAAALELSGELGEKANLHLTTATSDTTRSGLAIPGGAPRPDPIAKVVDGQAFFWRPDLGRRYYLVMPDEVPSAYFYAAVLASQLLEGAVADDCLADVFTVIWQHDHAALHPLVLQRSSMIELGYSDSACLNLAAGCSNSPRLEELSVGPGVQERRMRLGSYIGLETDYDTPRDVDDAPDLVPARARDVLLHELSHILGFEHPRYSALQPERDERSVRVPQSSEGTVASILFPTASPLFSPLPTPQDRRVLSRVYGGDCAYRAGYRYLGDVCSDAGELRCQALGGSCEVDGAAGERCRWHDFRDEAACSRHSAGTWVPAGAGDATAVFAGEAGACLASELPACVSESFVASAERMAGRCCTLFGTDKPGLLFEAFVADGIRHHFCSHQKGLGGPPDTWEFTAESELTQWALLDAAGGAGSPGWALDEGELVQERELPGNLALSPERMRSGCVMTHVQGQASGESGIVFNYRTPADYYVFDALPNVRRRIRHVVDGVSAELSVEPWPAPRGWATGVDLAVCHGDGIQTFIDGRLSSRVSVEQRVGFVGSGGRIGLWNRHNARARHAYLRVYSLVEGYATLR